MKYSCRIIAPDLERPIQRFAVSLRDIEAIAKGELSKQPDSAWAEIFETTDRHIKTIKKSSGQHASGGT